MRMSLSIPHDVQIGVEEIFLKNFDQPVDVHSFSAASGGCINPGGCLKTSVGDFFLKWNDSKKFPEMFIAEANGLQLLASTQSICIPEIIGHHQGLAYQLLLLKFIDAKSSPSKQFWATLGHQLAGLHRKSNPLFGLDHQNYIGSLKQYNSFKESWIDFFIEERINRQLKLVIDSGMADGALLRRFEKLYVLLPVIFPAENPSLLHGDLWSGNVLVNENGNPCLIDPAVYYGNREAELAYTHLFGGFEANFYSAYQERSPLHPGFTRRIDLYNIYPLLVHANLFGGSYLKQVISIVNSFV